MNLPDCWCSHPRTCHDHWRNGADCALCDCTRYRRDWTRLLPTRWAAARHELSCAQCRVTWQSWRRRLVGDPRGFKP